MTSRQCQGSSELSPQPCHLTKSLHFLLLRTLLTCAKFTYIFFRLSFTDSLHTIALKTQYLCITQATFLSLTNLLLYSLSSVSFSFNIQTKYLYLSIFSGCMPSIMTSHCGLSHLPPSPCSCLRSLSNILFYTSCHTPLQILSNFLLITTKLNHLLIINKAQPTLLILLSISLEFFTVTSIILFITPSIYK